MFLRNAWYVAAASDEVKDRPLARTLLNEPVVLSRDKGGNVFALEDRCCHRGAPLSLGWVTERGLMCGYHGLEFDVTGACVDVPGHRGTIPARARVKSYPVFEKTDFIWIWMGDAEKADPSLIVDYPPKDQLSWPRASDMLHVKANYVMVLENLMDLSHLSYVHRDSIGSSPEDSAAAEMDVKRTSTGVRFLRLMRNATTSASAKGYGIKDRCDRWSEFEYVAPSCIVQHTSVVDAGGYDQGVREDGQHIHILHAATPETERSCFYFFNKVDRDAEGFDENVSSSFKRLPTSKVFAEDAFVLEHQQARLEGFDTSRLVDIPSDVARVQMNRFLNQRILEEHGQAKSAAE